MKKTRLFIAALCAVAGITACTKADSQPEYTEYTLTVDATCQSVDTRALSLEGTTLKSVWASTDKVQVYKGATKIGTLTPQSTGSATTALKGTVTTSGVSAGTKLMLLVSPIDSWAYTNQEGSLDVVSSDYNYAKAEITVSAVNGSAISASAAQFKNQQAIVKFTLKNEAGSANLNATSIKISAAGGKLIQNYKVSGSNFEAVNGDITVASETGAKNVFYVALSNGLSGSDTYTVSTTVNNVEYSCTHAATFQNGKYYAGVVKMKEVTHTYTAVGGSAVFGSNWDPTDQTNNLTRQSDGKYKSKTYNVTVDPTIVEFKIVKDYSYDNGQWGGDGDNGNYSVSAGVGPLVITFDPTKDFDQAITVSYTKSTKENDYTVAGAPASVFGSEWTPSDTANDMVKQSNGTYVKTYSNVAAGTQVKFKVCINHKWDGCLGKSACDQTDVTSDNDGNCIYTKASAGTLTITFNPSTKKITVS